MIDESEMSRSLRSRDPLDVLIELEAQTCRGCRYEVRVSAFGLDTMVCSQKHANNRQRQHGTRCREFSEKQNGDTNAANRTG